MFWMRNKKINIFKSFLASCGFSRLLILFANRLDRTSVLIWIQPVCHSDSIPERFFKQILTKSLQMTKIDELLPSIQ